MRSHYRKEYNVKVYDGTNINFIKWDMMSGGLFYGKRKYLPQKVANRKMRSHYRKEYNVKVYDGTNINFIKWDMMSILKKILHLVMTDVTNLAEENLLVSPLPSARPFFVFVYVLK